MIAYVLTTEFEQVFFNTLEEALEFAKEYGYVDIKVDGEFVDASPKNIKSFPVKLLARHGDTAILNKDPHFSR